MDGRRIRFAVAVALLVLCLAPESFGQAEVDRSRRNAIVRALERVAPAVVSINVVVQRRTSPFDDLFWEFFYAPRPRYRKIDSIGSGFLFDDQGHILTNYHVIEDADLVHSVTLPDGRQLKVEFIGGDKRTDLAVLRAEGAGFPHAQLGDSDDLIIGEWVIAIGNPFGGLIEDPVPSASVGVVSANHRRLNPTIGSGERLYQDMIQTDAAINPGNSGGPLVNAYGDVVGVNTMIFSQSGGSVGLGFAVPINRARRIAGEIIRYGRRRDPWPGFRVQDLDSLPEMALREQGIRAGHGSLVVNILRNSPAYQAGLRPGDVITGVNGARVTSSIDIDYALWDLFVGDSVTLQTDRQGQLQTIGFKIEELARRPAGNGGFTP